MEWYFVLIIILSSVILLFFVLWFICLLPGNKKKCNDASFLYEKVIAHRGYYDNDNGIMENSKEAFERAIGRGYNIETDLSLTKDKEIVMYHDGNFRRLFGIDKKVSELTLKEIKELKFRDTDCRIMTFEEFLQLVNKKTGLLLEFKFDYTENDKILCEKAGKILNDYKGNFAVQSFNPLMVKYFRDHYPKFPRGQLYLRFNIVKGKKNFKEFAKGLPLIFYNMKWTNIISKPLFINEDISNYSFLDKLCSHFMKVIVWTVKTDEDYNKFYKHVDNIIFEKLNLENNGTKRK